MCAINFLKRAKSGILFYCQCSDKYQLLFKNINYNLTLEELEGFIHYVENVNEDYWEQEYKDSLYDKRIPIPSVQTNLMLLLDLVDLYELRELLDYKTKATKYITFREIDYAIMMN
jgi:hypothetical protein